MILTDKEKIEEIANEMKQQVKNETFLNALDNLTPDQQDAIKRWVMMNEGERIKKESNLY